MPPGEPGFLTWTSAKAAFISTILTMLYAKDSSLAIGHRKLLPSWINSVGEIVSSSKQPQPQPMRPLQPPLPAQPDQPMGGYEYHPFVRQFNPPGNGVNSDLEGSFAAIEQ
jgi:hypothetical protein